MLSYWSVPACALAVLPCLRLARLDWTRRARAPALVVAAVRRAAAAGCARRRRSHRAARRPTARTPRRRGASRSASTIAGAPWRSRSGASSGSHALIVGATGSGKTVTEALIVARAIERGHGAVIVDPKGDGLLRDARARRGRGAPGARSSNGRPAGPSAYNPYAPRQRRRDRRQGARGRALQRAALPAPGAALPRARGARAGGGRRDARRRRGCSS